MKIENFTIIKAHANKVLIRMINIVAFLIIITSISAQDKRKDSTEIVGTISGYIKVEHLAALAEPWGMAWLPDDRLIITEKPGR